MLSYSNWASVQTLTSGSKNKGLHVSGKMVLNRIVLTHRLPIQRANCVCCCVVVHLGHDVWWVYLHAACWRAPIKLHPSKTLNQKARDQVTVHSFYFIFSFLYSGHHASCFMTRLGMHTIKMIKRCSLKTAFISCAALLARLKSFSPTRSLNVFLFQ